MNHPVIVSMPQRFDYTASNEFNSLFGAALNNSKDSKSIILDCMHIDYIDSAGIGLLLLSHNKAQAVGTKMSIINIKPATKEFLMLANLQKLIEIS